MDKPRHQVFLCHATADKPVVREIARILRERGIEPWLDEWNLIPGNPWQEAIEEALRSCPACAVFLGPDGTGPWQNEEMRTAIDRQVSEGTLRVIPVLLPGANRGDRSRYPSFLVRREWVELSSPDNQRGLHRLISGIRGVEPGPGPGEEIALGVSPYRGLQFFDVEHAHLFFGREALIGWLLEKLRNSSVRFLALVGASGSGKSSLARAGLLGSLSQGKLPGSEDWPQAVLRLETNPLESLAFAVDQALALDNSASIGKLIQDFKTEPRTLHWITRRALRDTPERQLVVLLDQFEELFTRSEDEAARQALIANIQEAVTAPEGKVFVFLTLRADFLGACAGYPDFAVLLSDHQELVGPMEQEELLRAIERPARLAGCELDPGLTDLLWKEVERQPGGLPLLQHVLLQLWERGQGRRLRVEDYKQLGRLEGALNQYANLIFHGLSESERVICKHVFLRLVIPDTGSGVAKQRLTLQDLTPHGLKETDRAALISVVRELAQARLITISEPQLGSKLPTVELAHETLMRHWEELARWIDEDRESLAARQQLSNAAQDWNNNGQEPSYLLRGNRLVKVEEWAHRHPNALNFIEQEFLRASCSLRQREIDRERVEIRRLRRFAAVLAVTSILALGAALIAWNNWRNSINKEYILMATELGGRASVLQEKEPIQSLLLAIEAMRWAERGGNPFLPAVQQPLRDALAREAGIPLGNTLIVAFGTSENQRWLATAGVDGKIYRWDLSTRNPSAEFVVQVNEAVHAIALSNDGRWMLTRDWSRKSWLRDVSAPALPPDMAIRSWRSEPFSPDSRWLATHDAKALAGRLTLRNLITGSQSTSKHIVAGWSFTDDSLRLAVDTSQGTEIWNLRQENPLAQPIRLPGVLGYWEVDLAFTSDSRWLATRRLSDAPSAWRLGHLTQLRLTELDGCKASEFNRFKASGNWVSVWHYDSGAACIWDMTPEGASFLWEGEAYQLAVDPKHSRIVASRSDGTIWGAERSLEGLDEFRVRTSFASPRHMSFDPKGRLLVVEGKGEPPRLVSLYVDRANEYTMAITEDGRRSLLYSENGAFVRDSAGLKALPGEPWSTSIGPSAFSPDGSLLVITGADDSLHLVRIPVAGSPSFTKLPLNAGDVSTTYEFSADNRWLAIGYKSGLILVLDLWNGHQQSVQASGPELISLAFGPDSRLASSDKSGTIRLHNIRQNSSQIIMVLADLAFALKFNARGNLLAIESDREVILWGGNRDTIIRLTRSGNHSSHLAFSSDDKWLAAADGSKKVQLWNLEPHRRTGIPIRLEHPDPIRSGRNVVRMGFSADNGSLILVPSKGPPLRWELRVNRILEQACQAAGRNLSRLEWRTAYLPNEHFHPRTPCPGLPESPDIPTYYR